MLTADCEFCGLQYVAKTRNDGSAQLHSDECPLGGGLRKCLKTEAATLLRSAPLDIDLRATPRVRIALSSEIQNHLKSPRNKGVQSANDEEFDLAPVDAFQHESCKPGQTAALPLYVDNTRSLRLTQFGMLEEARRRKRPLSDPLYPQFQELRERKGTFKPARDFDNMDVQDAALAIEKYSINGFYVNGDGNVTCFHCGISFCRSMLHDNSWNVEQEHARWSPLCSYLLLRKRRDFVKGVLEDTRRIHMERNEAMEYAQTQSIFLEGQENNRINPASVLKAEDCSNAEFQNFLISSEASTRSE